MTAAVSNNAPSSYYVAVYVCVSVLVGMLLVLLIYVLCSKRYRLNWFEQTLLEAAEDKEDPRPRGTSITPSTTTSDIATDVPATPPPPPIVTTTTSGATSGAVGGATVTTEFWVPPSLQRQASVCHSDAPDWSGDESMPDTPNTPLGIKMSPFALQQMVVTGERFVQPASASAIAGPSSAVSVTGPSSTTTGAVRPKLSSMHSKLDHTKINAAMYQKPLVKTPSLPEDMRGSIQLTLAYDGAIGLLVVHLIQARDLVASDANETADPYAKVRVLPDKGNFRQSRVHKRTLQPEFEEEFAFQISSSEVGRRTLEILIYDFDQNARHRCMGSVQLPFERIDLSDKVTLWKGISPCDEKDDKAELGDLMFSLGYLPSAERLTVVILKARNLHPFDETRNSSDPYVKVSVTLPGRRPKKKKTSTVRGNVHPVFNEALTFSVARDLLRQVVLEFSVIHDSALLGPQKECLGRVVVCPTSKAEEGEHFRDMVQSKTAVARWHCLVEPEKKG